MTKLIKYEHRLGIYRYIIKLPNPTVETRLITLITYLSYTENYLMKKYFQGSPHIEYALKFDKFRYEITFKHFNNLHDYPVYKE